MQAPYKRIKINGKNLMVHRYVYECANGPIPTNMIVHHVDGDKFNNELSNLVLMTDQQHSEHHNQKHPKTSVCVVCGATFTPAPTKRKRQKTCSRPCFRSLMSSRIISDETRKKLSEACIRNGGAERGKTLVLHRWNKNK